MRYSLLWCFWAPWSSWNWHNASRGRVRSCIIEKEKLFSINISIQLNTNLLFDLPSISHMGTKVVRGGKFKPRMLLSRTLVNWESLWERKKEKRGREQSLQGIIHVYLVNVFKKTTLDSLLVGLFPFSANRVEGTDTTLNQVSILNPYVTIISFTWIGFSFCLMA